MSRKNQNQKAQAEQRIEQLEAEQLAALQAGQPVQEAEVLQELAPVEPQVAEYSGQGPMSAEQVQLAQALGSSAPRVQAPKKEVKLHRSQIAGPVAFVRNYVYAKKLAEPTTTRKQLVDELVGMGIADHTARTQTQVMLKAMQAQPAAPVAQAV